MNTPFRINIQLFAEGDTNPDETKDANLEKKGNPFRRLTEVFNRTEQEPKKEPDKEPDKEPEKEPESKPEPDKEPKKEPEKKPDKGPDKEPEKEPKDKEPENKPDEKPEDEFITIKHLGKEIQIPKSEQIKYIQMGYDYQHVKKEATTAKQALQKIAQIEGFNNVDEYLAEIDKREKARLAERLEEAAGDPDKIDEIIKNHPEVIKTKEERHRLEFEKAKAELSKDRFFKELESRFDEVMALNPTAKPDLVYKIIRSDYLTEEKLNELVTKEKASVEKKVLADLHDKERRAAPTGGDADGDVDTVTPTESIKKLSKLFGVSPTKAAQKAHEKLKQRS